MGRKIKVELALPRVKKEEYCGPRPLPGLTVVGSKGETRRKRRARRA